MSRLQGATFVSLVKKRYTVRRLREEMEEAGKSLRHLADSTIIRAMLEVFKGEDTNVGLFGE